MSSFHIIRPYFHRERHFVFNDFEKGIIEGPLQLSNLYSKVMGYNPQVGDAFTLAVSDKYFADVKFSLEHVKDTRTVSVYRLRSQNIEVSFGINAFKKYFETSPKTIFVAVVDGDE